MTHLDPETLALLALGEDAATASERLHLAGCARCREERDRFVRAVAATRDAGAPLEVPAEHVWTGIVGTLGLDAEALEPPAPAAVQPIRRRRRRWVVAAVAAAVLLVGGLGAVLASLGQAPKLVATADLHPFPDWKGQHGTAALERLSDGTEVLRVTTSVEPQASVDHEVWLMTAGGKRLVSLGYLRGTGGTFRVPAGIDPSRFRRVDVSDEPRDGNPAHSGDSIVRGELRS
jgi:hypothetical protein